MKKSEELQHYGPRKGAVLAGCMILESCYAVALLLLTVGVSLLAVSCGGSGLAYSPTPDERADSLIAQMTLDEKIQMVHGVVTPGQVPPRGAGAWVQGVPRLNIPDLYLADGSVGVSRTVGPATALPSSIASAASWDLALAYKYGHVIGAELSAYGINLNLGGNINLTGREPRDGRTFETKGEDPLLAGSITAQHLTAIQDQYVLADIKHFAFNDQETGRGTANSLIDDRSARESDLLAFEIAIAGSNVQSVMCSYNLVNGVYACQNPYLLNTVLKQGWAYPGFVLSDFEATHSTVDAALNGLDQEEPDDICYGSALQQAVLNGEVPEAQLDAMVHRILRAMFEAGLFDHPLTIQPIDIMGDGDIAQEVEEQGAVLLKNAGVLPLDGTVGSIAVIGSHADVGVLSGGGSSQVDPLGGPALIEGQPCPPCGTDVIWDPAPPLIAFRTIANSANIQYDDGTNPASAVALAANSKVAIVFISQWASEAMDIPSLNFTDVIHSTPIDQDTLVNAVAAANRNTIVVMENGGPQVMPWLGQVNAVLEAWYPGQHGGEAIANILFGKVNPSGKLPITFPASVSQLPRPVIPTPPDPVTPFPVDYNIEGYNEGYKWYESKGLTPLFPFGFGLSYTTFSITNPKLVFFGPPDNASFKVSFDLRNTGTRSGSEVAQVYLQLPSSANEVKRLVGWQKVPALPNQQENVTIQVNANDPLHPFSYWDVNTSSWVNAPGTYTVYLGNSSQNLVAVGTFQWP
jgi:beta-glucosidase